MGTLRSITTATHAAERIGAAANPDLLWSREGYGLVGWGVAAEFDPGVGTDRFDRAWEWFESTTSGAEILDPVDVPGSGPIAFCSFTFDPDSHGSRIVIPRVVGGWAETGGWVTSNGDARRTPDFSALFRREEASAPAEVISIRQDHPTEEFIAAVERARSKIRDEGMSKVVLARSMTMNSATGFDRSRIIDHLMEQYPGCFTFLNGSFLGATPELLVRRSGGWVDSIPLAGSSRRGANISEDEALGAALLASTKDRWEHELAVLSVVEKLSALCEDLAVEREPFLYLLPNVQHLGTKIQGRLRGEVSALQIAGVLHPTAAVCGVPEADALDTIRKLEPDDRGIYSGTVGWVDRHGDGEMAIALRCARIDGNTATIYAGAGIVADSDPYAELAETELKARAMLEALSS